MSRGSAWRESDRREFLKAGLLGVGVSAGLPLFWRNASIAEAARVLEGGSENHPNRILVVVELSGGNDGLNTVVPYKNDAYLKARPTLGIGKQTAIKLDDDFGLNPACEGLSRLYKEGKLAIVHGCGYPNPNLSHFTAMEWWHTAMPHGNDAYGWLGRFADAHRPDAPDMYVVNVAEKESLAVHSARHSPVVFKDPRRLGRQGSDAQQEVFARFGEIKDTANPALAYARRVARTASAGAAKVRHACAEYKTLVDYGSDNEITLDLKRLAAMIAAGLPTRIYYVSMGGYDTHAAQAALHNLNLIYLSDALAGFVTDLERIGRADDVAIMVFTEFGRRVAENASKGTDHGTATPMFLIGKPVKGGFYGAFPSLTDLDDGNLKMTTDFRSVYGTVLSDWMGFGQTEQVLRGKFPTIGVFG